MTQDQVLTVKEEIMVALFQATKPLSCEQIADRINRSRSAVNSNLTDLRKDRRVEFLGKEVGWKACHHQPPGTIRGVGRI